MKEDYQTIIRKGIHAELADWMLTKKKQPLPSARRSDKKPRRRLSRIMTGRGWVTLFARVAAISFVGYLTIQAIMSF